MTMRVSAKFWIVILLSASLIGGIARPSLAILDKTRFVAHLGVAYFCYHHWVSQPYKEGKLSEGAPHRTASIIKAGGALLFAVHEIKVSSKIAHASNDKLLQKVAGALDNMGESFSSIGSRFKAGSFSKSDVDALGTSFGQMDRAALANKISVKDVPVAIPGN